MRNLETPSTHQLTVPGAIEHPRSRTPTGYASRSPRRSPRREQPPASSNFLTVMDNPAYKTQMSNLRSTISTFSGSSFDPKAWRNQTMNSDRDALFKSKAEDPASRKGQGSDWGRATFDHSLRATYDPNQNKKTEGMSYNTIMQKIDKKQKLINELKELSKFDTRGRLKPTVETSFKHEKDYNEKVKSPMLKIKQPAESYTYQKKEYPASCTFIETSSPTKPYSRANVQRSRGNDGAQKKESFRHGEKKINTFNPFSKSPTNISSPNAYKSDAKPSPLLKTEDHNKNASPSASKNLRVPSDGEKTISLSHSSRELITPSRTPSVFKKNDQQKSRVAGSLSVSDFFLGKSLGEGKFGAVFQAVHKESGWLFALKKIPKKMIKEHYMEDQFLLQVKIQSFCDHQNILKIYGCFDDREFIYLVLQYMEEGTLFAQMKKSKTLSEEETARKIKDVTQAIKYLHNQGVAHRDIKPQNIVLSNQVGKLCDFGWAAICNERRKTYCGTFDYAAPQILEGAEYDYTVDLWCIGVLAYELLVGKAPFYHISRKETMKKIMNVETNSIEFPSTLSRHAVSFVQNLVRKNPQERMVAEDMLKHPFLTQIERPHP